MTLLLSFRKKISDFDFSLLLGNQVIDKNFRTISHSTNALILPDFYNVATNKSGEPTIGESYFNSRSYGLFADLSIGYKDFLFLHGSARNDKTSLLSEDNRSFFYPGGDISFVFTDAFKNAMPKWLNYGKVRFALSQTGQVSLDPYSLKSIFNVGAGFPYGGVGGYSVGDAYANPNLKPERTLEKELGLELGLLNNRINFSLALYQQNTKDQTIPIGTSLSTGFSSAFVNSGEMENKGVEIDLKLNVIRSKDWNWSLGGNFTYNKNTVKSLGYDLPEVAIGGSTFATIGQPYGVIKATDWSRDPEGRIIVDKSSGFPQVASSLVYFGTSVAPYRAGINTNLSYKGFTLTVVTDGRFGAIINNDLGQDLDFTGSSWYTAQTGREAFVIPNSVYSDGKGGYTPNTNVTVKEGNSLFWANTWNQQQSPYINSADFWKLREVSFSYEIPKSALAKLKVLKQASISIIGRNLAMWKAKDNPWTDPEYSNTSGNATGTTDINQTPPTRFYGATLQLTF